MVFIVRALAGFLLSLLFVAPALSDQILLNIRPGAGIGPLTLGMSVEDVQKQLGEPDEAATANETLAKIRDLPQSTFSLVQFDLLWGYSEAGAPFYKLLFKDGQLVFIMCTYQRMGSYKLAKAGKMLPPLTKSVVEDVFGPPAERKLFGGRFNHMMYYGENGGGMAFAHTGPGETPVGMLMYGRPSSQAPAPAVQAQAPQKQTQPLTAKGCLREGEAIDDPRTYVERYYRCDSLASVGTLALPASIAQLWKSAEERDLIDQPFSIMGNDYEISDLSVVQHELKSFNPHSIELTVRASFWNFGEPQTVDWVFQDDLNDQQPMTLVDIRGVSPAAYSMAESLRDMPKAASVPVPAARPAGTATAAPVARPAIADLYGALLASGIAPNLRYPIRFEGGRWVTTSPDWDAPMPVTVDDRKGYIRILDEGSGGGSFETQVGQWHTAGNAALLGIAETAIIQPGQEPSRVRFFEAVGGNWTEQTGYVWPDVLIADFMTGEMTIADLRDLNAIGASVYVKFTPGGMDVEAALIVPEETVHAVCNGEDWFVPADKGPYLRYCERLAGNLFSSLPLEWNAAEGRFLKGEPKKLAKAPKTCEQTGTLIQEAAENKRAATIFEFDCSGTKTRIYQYRDVNTFRVLHPPNWENPIGDFKTYSEALAAAVAAGGG